MINEKDKKKLIDFFEAQSADLESQPEYWINGADEGLSYCLECCEEKVKQLQQEQPDQEFFVDGGSYSAEGESVASCMQCGKILENSLTNDGCEEEIDYFLEEGFDIESEIDCYTMTLIIESQGWEPIERTFISRYSSEEQIESEVKAGKEYFRKFYIVCERILGKI